jgi:hypothetical protein
MKVNSFMIFEKWTFLKCPKSKKEKKFSKLFLKIRSSKKCSHSFF